jgi:hypothetical protein
MSIVIEKYKNQPGIYVLRDDLLPGGTKSILLDSLLINHHDVNELVYASPCYGGFQIALSIFCKNNNKKATIFCAKRTMRHPNTEICIQNGANVIEVPYGYLSVVEKHAREYVSRKTMCQTTDAEGGVLGAPLVPLKIAFGANSPENINIIASRAKCVIESFHTTYGTPPDELWCAVGSGTLINGIIQAVNEMQCKGSEGTACPLKIYGVQVGKEFKGSNSPNVTILVYPKPFEYESKLKIDFPSMKNYDLKAFELCLEYNKNKSIASNIYENKKVLFWNVL